MNRRRLMSSSGVKIDPVTGRGFVGDYEVVDLGLPSGLLWATNLLDGHYLFGAGSAKYPNGSYGSKGILPPNRDTATQVMGDAWRMPTVEDVRELFNNTT